MYSSAKLIWLLVLAAVSSVHESIPLSGDTSCPSRADIHPCDCRDRDGIISVRCHAEGKSSTLDDLKPALRALSGKRGVELSLLGYFHGKVPSDFFSTLDIKKLLFSGGEIDEFESPAFRGLEDSLEALGVVTAVSERGIVNFNLNLQHLRRLRVLDVSGNSHGVYFDLKKMTLGNSWFDNGPSSLRTVRFSSNRLETIGDRVFSKLSNVREVDLRRNELEEVRRSMLPESADELVSINLSYNKLAELPDDFFQGMPSLERLDVTGNEMGTLDQRTWESVWERLEVLKFGEIVCDSNIDWVFEMKRPTELQAWCSEHSLPDRRNQRLDILIDQKQRH